MRMKDNACGVKESGEVMGGSIYLGSGMVVAWLWRLWEAQSIVFYVSGRLWEDQLVVFCVSGRVRL